jgi:hypothetical protein
MKQQRERKKRKKTMKQQREIVAEVVVVEWFVFRHQSLSTPNTFDAFLL